MDLSGSEQQPVACSRPAKHSAAIGCREVPTQQTNYLPVSLLRKHSVLLSFLTAFRFSCFRALQHATRVTMYTRTDKFQQK
jgi:hypothetical protein